MEFGVGVGRGLAELLKREDRWNLSTLSDMIEECVRSDATRASFFFFLTSILRRLCPFACSSGFTRHKYGGVSSTGSVLRGHEIRFPLHLKLPSESLTD